MPSPIFNSMNQGQKPQNRGMNIVQDYNKFQQNPFAFIMERRGINVPEDCRHDPEKALETAKTEQERQNIRNMMHNM